MEVQSVPSNHFSVFTYSAWNFDVTKGQGTGKMCSLYRGFVISWFFFIYFAITGVKKIVRYTEDVEVHYIEVPLYFSLTVLFYSHLCPFFSFFCGDGKVSLYRTDRLGKDR